MSVPRPYYLKNKEWYYYDKNERCIKLTDKAPPEAVESFKTSHTADTDSEEYKEWLRGLGYSDEDIENGDILIQR